MKYLFSCRSCGEYRVARKTFLAFLTPKLRCQTEERLKEKGKELVLEFLSQFCPRCRPHGQATGILKIRRAGQGGDIDLPS